MYGIPEGSRVAIFQGSMTDLRNLDNLARATRYLEEDCRLAVVTLGYGDGLPLDLPHRGGRVLIRGRSCPMVGWMCMDQTLIDVTGVPDAAPGDVATFLGRDGAAEIRAEELAAQCDTIPNELLSRLSPRLRLVYRRARGSE